MSCIRDVDSVYSVPCLCFGVCTEAYLLLTNSVEFACERGGSGNIYVQSNITPLSTKKPHAPHSLRPLSLYTHIHTSEQREPRREKRCNDIWPFLAPARAFHWPATGNVKIKRRSLSPRFICSALYTQTSCILSQDRSPAIYEGF